MNRSSSSPVVIYGQSLVHMWEECPRCFWRRYVLSEKRPRDFGETFDIADQAMKACVAGSEWVDVGVGPAKVRVHSQSVWVESAPIDFPQFGLSIALAGKYDAIVEDETETKILVDYKTTHKAEEQFPPYRRQLDAYRFALEHPNPENPQLQPPMQIDEIGLLIYTPVKFAFKSRNSGLYGPTRWVDFDRDDSAFMRFLGDVAQLLAGPEPLCDEECQWCAYREIGAKRIA